MADLPVLIIPAYQPDPKLVKLVDDLLSSPYRAILVVNDGSRPEKAGIFSDLAKRPRVTVLTHAVNLGKGAALKTALNHLLVHMPDAAGAVTVDADGQHLPASVAAVAQELQSRPNSLVLGVRTFKAGIPFFSRFGNIMTGYIFHFLIGKKLRDTQTSLRGVPASLMRDLLVLRSSRYEFELDMLIAATTKRLPFIEVPIATVYEDGNKGSRFNPLRDSFRIYFVFLRFTFGSLMTYLTDLAVFTVTQMLTQKLFLSFVLGRACGVTVSMLVGKAFVFKSDQRFGVIALRMFVLWLTLLGISYGLMLLLVDVWHFNVYPSRIAVDSLLFLFNFVVQRELIFGIGKRGEPEEAAA